MHMREMSGTAVTAVLAVTVLAVTGLAVTPSCAAAQSRDTTVRLSSGTVVDVTLRTGRLVVRGVDGNSGTVRSGGSNYELRSTGVTFTLRARDDERGQDRRERRERRDEQPLELDLPRGVRLVVSSISADVEVHDLAGTVEVRSTSGDVLLERTDGRVIVETISGDVRSTGSAAALRVTTVSGDLRVCEARGELDLHTTSGDVSVSGERIARFVAQTMSGDVQFDGLLARDARVQVTTHGGDVTMQLPDDAHGELGFSTFNGDFVPGGPVTIMPGASSRRSRSAQRFSFGTGAGPGLSIDISTFNGDVRLVRSVRR